MLAADARFKTRSSRPSVGDGHFYQLAHSIDVERLEGVVGENATFDIRGKEAARIVSRYRHLLVTADAIPTLHRRPVVRVDSMRDLARLAKLHDELVVHADESGVHRFALFTDPVVYLFEMGTSRERAPQTDMAKWALACSG